MSQAYSEFRKLMNLGKYSEAARYAEREQLDGSGQNVFWLTQQAVALIRSSEYESALKVSEEALAMDGANPYAVIASADALFGLDRPEEALNYYKDTLKFDRLSQRSQRGVLECLSKLKNWQEMLLNISTWEMAEQYKYRYRVKALAALGRHDEAIEECNKWLQLQPHNHNALWELTELEIRRDGLDSVVGKMGKMARIPSLPPIYKEIYASLCRKAGKPDEAIKAYSKIEAGGANLRIQQKTAFTLAKTGREREAIPMLEELLRAEPGNKYLRSSFEAACGRIGELEGAINFYNRLLGLFPEERSLYGRIKRLEARLEKMQ